MTTSVPLVELRGVSKRFVGVQALREVNLTVHAGTVHGLVGENGAGKSTLGKLIAGVHRPDRGQLLIEGRSTHFQSPHDALAEGMTIIAQELALAPHMTVIENVFLGAESRRFGVVDRRALRHRFDKLRELGFELEPNEVVAALSTAQQQKVEILRAIARDARLIVMDEPTASLTPDECARLTRIVRRLTDTGTTIVFVSHALTEVLDLCDTISVMRDGRVVRTAAAAGQTPDSLVNDMVGRRTDLAFPPLRPVAEDAPLALQVAGLTVDGTITDITFDIRRGEIVGLAGLIGSGRSDVARAIFGAEQIAAGEIRVQGETLGGTNPRAAIQAGLAMLPESRKESGLLMGRSITENISLAHLDKVANGGVVAQRDEKRRAHRAAAGVQIKTPSFDASVATLSGGNQQKVLFAKWLFEEPIVLIADEPTRGVDVAAKASIHKILVDLAAQGMAILLISSELEDVVGLSHRILVMRDGRIVREMAAEDAESQAVLSAAFGAAGLQTEELVIRKVRADDG